MLPLDNNVDETWEEFCLRMSKGCPGLRITQQALKILRKDYPELLI